MLQNAIAHVQPFREALSHSAYFPGDPLQVLNVPVVCSFGGGGLWDEWAGLSLAIHPLKDTWGFICLG